MAASPATTRKQHTGAVHKRHAATARKRQTATTGKQHAATVRKQHAASTRRWLSMLAILLGLLGSVALGRLVAAAPRVIDRTFVQQPAADPANSATALRPPG